MKITKKLIVLLLFFGCAAGSLKVSDNAVKSITSEELLEHISFLASDEMQGRDTPSPELDECAKYIANEFKSYRLKPASENGTFYQKYYVEKNKLDLTETEEGIPNKFAIIRDEEKEEFKIKTEFVPHFMTSDGEITSTIVFAGYGITAPEYNYDDYKDIDVQGKIVLIMTHEPQEDDTTSIFKGIEATDYSKEMMKYQNAVDHGAAGLILVKSPADIGRRPPQIWPSLMKFQIDAVPLTLDLGVENSIPAIFIHKKIADKILKAANSSLKEVHKQIDKDLIPRSLILIQ